MVFSTFLFRKFHDFSNTVQMQYMYVYVIYMYNGNAEAEQSEKIEDRTKEKFPSRV
jgi:hypothetical protein